MDKWSGNSEPINHSGLTEILSALPRPTQACVDLTINGQELFDVVKKMAQKAVGLDQWGAETLRLPPEWWQGLGRLWTLVLSCGQVPLMWRRALSSSPKHILSTVRSD